MNKQDEEKAIEIVDETHLYEEGTKYLHTDRVMCETLLEMAAWKQEQMIDKAVEWLMKNKNKYIRIKSMKTLVDDSMIEDFKQAMEE